MKTIFALVLISLAGDALAQDNSGGRGSGLNELISKGVDAAKGVLNFAVAGGRQLGTLGLQVATSGLQAATSGFQAAFGQSEGSSTGSLSSVLNSGARLTGSLVGSAVNRVTSALVDRIGGRGRLRTIGRGSSKEESRQNERSGFVGSSEVVFEGSEPGGQGSTGGGGKDVFGPGGRR